MQRTKIDVQWIFGRTSDRFDCRDRVVERHIVMKEDVQSRKRASAQRRAIRGVLQLIGHVHRGERSNARIGAVECRVCGDAHEVTPAGERALNLHAVSCELGALGVAQDMLRLEHIVSCHVYLTDIRYREPVYRVLGERLAGVHPVFTGLVVSALARPEWVVEVTAVAVLP